MVEEKESENMFENQQQVIEENERLENLFKDRILNKKKQTESQIQFKNKLIELLQIMSDNIDQNSQLEDAFYKRAAYFINKTCLGSQYDFLNKKKILDIILNFLQKRSVENLLENLKDVEEIIKSIFNLIVYKKSKSNIQDVTNVLKDLLQRNNKDINNIFKKNIYILINFFQKGKEIDKIFFTFEKLLKSSEFFLLLTFTDMMQILTETKNKFFLFNFVKFLSKIKFSAIKNKNTQKTLLQTIENNIKQVAKNLRHNVLLVDNSQQKKQKKIKNYFKILIRNIPDEYKNLQQSLQEIIRVNVKQQLIFHINFLIDFVTITLC